MRKIAFVNLDCFVEVDTALLPRLSKVYDVLWIEIQTVGSYRCSPTFLEKFADRYGVELVRYDVSFRNRSFKNFNLYQDIIKRVRQFGAEILINNITNVYFDVSVIGLNIPIIKCVHDYSLHSGASFFQRLSHRLSLLLNKHYIFYSNSQYDLFRSENPFKTANMVGFPVIDYGKPSLDRPELSSGIKFLFFGRIESYKGLDLLIKAFEQIADKEKNVFLSICGNGPEWNNCKKLIRNREHYNLQIRFIDNDEIPDIFFSHHFLVLPYRDATQSGPFSIALNYNLPIIAPCIKCFVDQCPYGTAIIYEQGKLLDAMTHAVTMNPAEYNQMCKSWLNVKNYNSPTLVADNYCNFIENILTANS